jgi:hypothetical protein
MKPLLAIAAAAAVAGGSLHVTLTGGGAKPKAGAHWPYKAVAVLNGKPAKGTITAQIVDPIGGVHAVQFGANTKNVTRIPFKGTFKDYVIWPKDAVGYPLKFRVIVVAGGKKQIASTTVTVQK